MCIEKWQILTIILEFPRARKALMVDHNHWHPWLNWIFSMGSLGYWATITILNCTPFIWNNLRLGLHLLLLTNPALFYKTLISLFSHGWAGSAPEWISWRVLYKFSEWMNETSFDIDLLSEPINLPESLSITQIEDLSNVAIATVSFPVGVSLTFIHSFKPFM